MTMRIPLTVFLLLLSVPGSAWEFVVGAGMARSTWTTEFVNNTVKFEEYEIDMTGGNKVFGRFNFTPYFGIQAEMANYGQFDEETTISNTINNVTTDVIVDVDTTISSQNFSFFIGSNREDFFAMFGKFGYSSYTNDVLVTITDPAQPVGQQIIYSRDEEITERAPLLGFGVSFRLPWNLFILGEYEILNGDDDDVESANLLVEYRF